MAGVETKGGSAGFDEGRLELTYVATLPAGVRHCTSGRHFAG